MRERYVNYLEKKEDFHKDDFTEKEDAQVLKYFDLYPHDWNAFANHIPTKSAA